MCGIICRMTDDNLDDTLPTLISSGLTKSTPPEDSSLDVTQPTAGQRAEESPSSPITEPGEAPPLPEQSDNSALPPEKKKRSRWALIPLAGIIILLIIAVLSGMAGYRSGITIRTDAEKTLVSQQAREQYELGLQDIEMGFFERARQRFEYVIRLDPSYPGAADQLALVLLEINTTATPTLVPTPTLTPTPDTRGIDGLFDTATQQLANADWDGAYESLLRLRKQDPTYHAVDIDGMLFLVLRNRGMDKIAMQADLEGGLYDLALAARFGPLDNEAQGYMNWTTLYLTGASFWDLDWRQVVYYFEQIAPQLPYLKDGSGLTAIERYRLGLIGLGDTLMREGDACTAVEKYQLALSYGADPEVDLALAEAVEACSGAEEEAPPSTEATPVIPSLETPQPPPVVTDTPTEPPPVEPTTDPNVTPTP
ncbi:MAG: hypothetical protein H6Q38_1663 [Chloroflexi bacterium]|nr:hypothetical protein [Chloroflexota bacterium]